MTRYIRALATLVTPDPNAMCASPGFATPNGKCQATGRREGKLRTMALGDAMQIASALWVKEAIGVPDLEFLTFDDWCSPAAKPSNRLCLLHLQDYAVDVGGNADVKAAIRLTRLEPVVHAKAYPDSVQRRRGKRPTLHRRQSFPSRLNSASMTGARMVLTAKIDPWGP